MTSTIHCPPPTKGYHSYQAPPTECHLSYQARFNFGLDFIVWLPLKLCSCKLEAVQHNDGSYPLQLNFQFMYKSNHLKGR
jgi:hypothetical protein